MAAQDEDAQAPEKNLEPPKLFGRRRPPAPETAPTDAAASAPVEGDTRVFDDTAVVFDDSGSDLAPVEPADNDVEQTTPADAAPATRRRIQLPFEIPANLNLPAIGAAAAGLVTGIALLAMMWVAFRGCELARGNESCTPGAGMTALVAVFVLTVVIGRFLLVLVKLPEPGMTSFLAVGLTSLVSVLLLGGLFDSVAILVVLPLLSAAAFAVATWVATLTLDAD